MAASPNPTNPLVKLAVAGAGIASAFVANQLLEKGWSAMFGEDAPTEKAAKTSAKDVKTERKQAKKDGLSKDEIAEITDPMDDMPVWKILLWTVLSGIAIQSLRLLAERGAERGASALFTRRPRSNRG
ncbi:DUF4235 domain-containing protein [Brachybacterium huguangmaarense]